MRMIKDMKWLMVTLAGYPVLWLLSAVIHLADADLSDVAFSSLFAMPSVYIIAGAMFAPCLIAVVWLEARGVKAYWAILLGAALLISMLLTIGGSTATDFWGYAASFTGLTLICALFLMPGTLPGILFLRIKKKEA